MQPGAGRARALARSPPAGRTRPVLRLPACAHTIVAGESGGSASARMRPWPSTGTRTRRLRPKPTRPSALISVGCASSPITTVIGGAPNRPSASTSQSWPREHGVARGGERAEVGHRRAGHERARRALREPEELAHPVERDRLEQRGRGGRRVGTPRSDPRPSRASSRPARPAASRRSRSRRSAGRPCPSSPASRPRRAARARPRLARPVRERLAQHAEAGDRVGAGRDGALLDLGQVARRAGGRALQQFVHVISRR